MSHLTVHLARIEGRDPPYDHNYLLGGAVYRLLNEFSVDGAKVLHDSTFRTSYVLSEIYRVTGKVGESWFRIGTGYEKVLKIAEKAIAVGTFMRIGGTVFQISKTSIWNPSIHSGEFITLSPILLKDKNTGLSVVNDSEGYESTLELAVNSQISNYLKKDGTVNIKHFENLGVRKRTIKGRTVLAQKGRFLMVGTDEELEFLVDYGVGLSPALGFGMIVPTQEGGEFE